MKKHFYLFAIIFALSVFNSPIVKANGGGDGNDGHNNGNGNGGHDNGYGNGGHDNGDNGSSDTNLPINNGILFLTIAGVAIGIVAVKKATAKSVAA